MIQRHLLVYAAASVLQKPVRRLGTLLAGTASAQSMGVRTAWMHMFVYLSIRRCSVWTAIYAFPL